MNDQNLQPDPPEVPDPRNTPDVPDTLPPALLRALRELDEPMRMPPPELDEAVLSGARAHFAQIRQGRKRSRLFLFAGAGTALAAAAAIAVAFIVGLPEFSPNPTDPGPITGLNPNPTPDTRPNDLNSDGKTDIADAMLLARAGSASQEEIDKLCMTLVKVTPQQTALALPSSQGERIALAPSPSQGEGWGEGRAPDPQRSLRQAELVDVPGATSPLARFAAHFDEGGAPW